jgi:uncharacterized protein YdhG (YjbR/CyaY superfamily)
MHSNASDVTAYLREVPPDRQECLARLRALCLETLVGYEECMEYGMPCYKKNGAPEVGFASQKRYISLYITKEDVVNQYRDLLGGLSVGKGCIRYTRVAQVDLDVVRQLLVATRESPLPGC